MKEVLLISDKGGTGKSSILGILKEKYSSEAVFADCSFTSDWPHENLVVSEEYFYLGNEPVINNDLCLFCGDCETACEFVAIDLRGEGVHVDRQKCTGCGHCYYICPAGAIRLKTIKTGKIFTLGDPENGLIVFGALHHYPKNGTRPVSVIRNKALELTRHFDKKWLILEAPTGWNIITSSLLYYSAVLVIIIEPHQLVFDFLEKIRKFSDQNKIKVKLVISKSDINTIITTRIIQEFNPWEIICLPWTENPKKDNGKYFENFLNDEN